MSLACPQCGTKFAALGIRNHFTCRHCAAKLKGSTSVPWTAGIVLWAVADLMIYPLVYSNMGNTMLAHAVRIAVSACIGFPLIFVLVKAFGTVTLDDEKQKGS